MFGVKKRETNHFLFWLIFLVQAFSYAWFVTDTIVCKNGEYYSFLERIKSFYVLRPNLARAKTAQNSLFSRHIQ